MYKHIIKGEEEALQKYINGARWAEKVVGSTMGPKGRNVLIGEKYQAPSAHNDGANVARKIVLEDPTEDLAYQTIVDVALSQNQQVGDGTTTAVVLAANIVIDNLTKILGDMTGGDPVGLAELIEKDGARAVELLKATKGRPLQDDELINVITTSLRNPEFAKTIASMLKELGKDCHIDVTDNWKTKFGIETELITGCKKPGSYAERHFINTKAREAVWEDTYVLVTNNKIESASHMVELFKEIQAKGKLRLVIVNGHSEDSQQYSKPFVQKLIKVLEIARKGQGDALEILPIKCPALTSEELQDVAVFCDAKFIDKNAGMDLKSVRLVDLGHAKQIVVDEDDFLILGGRGNAEERISVLSSQLSLEKDVMFAEKLKRRIAALSAGAGVIRVGAMTTADRTFKKMKIEDAVNAAKAAMEEGVVPGGGIDYMEVAEELGKDSPIYNALKSINKKIQDNANGKLVIGKDILNALKSDRLAIEAACSAASRIVAAGWSVAKQPRTLWDDLDKRLTNRDEESDFRDDSNQDLGSGRLI